LMKSALVSLEQVWSEVSQAAQRDGATQFDTAY